MKKYSPEEKEEIMSIAEKFQDECHETIQVVREAKAVSYQDATNVWMFKKLAELQFEINSLKNPKKGTDIKK